MPEATNTPASDSDIPGTAPTAAVISDDSYVGKALKEVAALEQAVVVQGPKMVKYAWPREVVSPEAATLSELLLAEGAAHVKTVSDHIATTRAALIAQHEAIETAAQDSSDRASEGDVFPQ